jgi:hypothetical protein
VHCCLLACWLPFPDLSVVAGRSTIPHYVSCVCAWVSAASAAGCCVCCSFCRQAVAEHKPKIVFLTSPNNPDGSVISDEDLLQASTAHLVACLALRTSLAQACQHHNCVGHMPACMQWCPCLALLNLGGHSFHPDGISCSRNA